ncbi:MAG TPA: DUF177 domain-containing protein [Candidatus Binataceae bacterium]|nr:DUF177 domain-containing protein [Candidatus Binataceae bacterium]
MKLRIEEITSEEQELEFRADEHEVNRLLERGPVREYHLRQPFTIHLTYYRAGMELFFAGTLSAEMTALCARCTEQFQAPSQRQFRFVLAPRVLGEGGRRDLGSEDLEFSTYAGDEIDLLPLVSEQLLLALPMRPLCAEDCRGLCARCGANLNWTSCACDQAPADPRFAVFRSLKVTRS